MPIHGLPPSLSSSGPPHFDIEKVIRPNILALHPYRCARDDYKEGILLDANENALGSCITSKSEESASASTPSNNEKAINDLNALNLHRYPDPTHDPIKERIASIRGIPGANHIFLGVGSDEVIDLLMRVCVTPAKEKILITPPTYGMYSVCAQVNDTGVVKVPLQLSGEKGEGGTEGRFSLQVDEIKKAIDADPSIKLIFICSPGNPTGTYIPLSSIKALLDYEPFKGIVAVDEAYIDFVLFSTESESDKPSAVSLVKDYANLCVMQTFSKSFGLAAVRAGVAIAQPPLIQVLTNTKAPYNISTPTAHLVLSALSPSSLTSMRKNIQTLLSNRSSLLQALAKLVPLGAGSAIGGNDANFVIIPILSKEDGRNPDNTRSQKVYRALAGENHVVVRYRGGEPGCEGCLRITVGTEEENKVVVEKLEAVLKVL